MTLTQYGVSSWYTDRTVRVIQEDCINSIFDLDITVRCELDGQELQSQGTEKEIEGHW